MLQNNIFPPKSMDKEPFASLWIWLSQLHHQAMSCPIKIFLQNLITTSIAPCLRFKSLEIKIWQEQTLWQLCEVMSMHALALNAMINLLLGLYCNKLKSKLFLQKKLSLKTMATHRRQAFSPFACWADSCLLNDGNENKSLQCSDVLKASSSPYKP